MVDEVAKVLDNSARMYAERALKMWFGACFLIKSGNFELPSVLIAVTLNKRAIDECSKAVNTYNFISKLEQQQAETV